MSGILFECKKCLMQVEIGKGGLDYYLALNNAMLKPFCKKCGIDLVRSDESIQNSKADLIKEINELRQNNQKIMEMLSVRNCFIEKIRQVLVCFEGDE